MICRDGVRTSLLSDQHGTSLDDAQKRLLLSYRRNGWLDDEATKMEFKIEYDPARTKKFDDNDLWKPYL